MNTSGARTGPDRGCAFLLVALFACVGAFLGVVTVGSMVGPNDVVLALFLVTIAANVLVFYASLVYLGWALARAKDR